MSSAAAPPSLLSLHRSAVTARVATAAPSNSVHLANLDKLFSTRGVAVESSAMPAKAVQAVVAGTRWRQQPVAVPSPRGNIAEAWGHLHGEHGWRGLLDPLHPDLRREIVRYGEFVDAAYGAFLSRPDAEPGHPHRARVPLQDAAYRVTAPLFATSSVGLPTWLAAAAPCASQRTSLVGYVAVCDSPAEVRRMGRRDIVVALRGTCTVLEWAENVRAGLVPATASNADTSSKAKVECGFWNLYKTAGADGSPSLSGMVVSEVRRLLDKYKGEEVSITVTGHSLGAALAVLIADELAGGVAGQAKAPVAVFSFGGPRVGNHAFAARVEARGARVLRVVNAQDVVPRFPPGLPLPGYADVGRELRLDSRASPYLRPVGDAACFHDLEAYIHLVDGFVGSHCPFRETGQEPRWQRKQLYIRKAKDVQMQLQSSAADMPGAANTVVECVRDGRNNDASWCGVV